MSHLRPYQLEAVASTFVKWQDYRSTLLVMPTGCGKTVVFSEIIRRHLENGGRRALVVAHRGQLLQQAGDKIQRFAMLACEYEQAEYHAWKPGDTTVLATVQTLRGKRLESWERNAFDLIVIDEAHHAAADSYAGILDHFFQARVLGVTATPDRSDGAALRSAFESVAMVYDIRDAIEQGFLAPIKQRAVWIEGLDLSKVKTVAGDLNEGQLEAIMVEEGQLHGVVGPTLELAGDRPTMVFATTVAHANALAVVFNRHRPGCAKAIDGSFDTWQRNEFLTAFRSREFQFLINCQLFTEGFDEPGVSCIAMARPTKSRALYVQCVGRGTRLAPGKTDCLVIDFEGNAGKHSLVCALDVLDGNEDADVREKALELTRKGAMDVGQALEAAAKIVADDKRRKVLAKARYTSAEIDPFMVLNVAARAGRWGGAEATDKQRSMLDGAGLKLDWTKVDKGQASALISEIMERRTKGLCTFKQAQQLAKRGLRTDVTFQEAGEIMNTLAANRWQVPSELAERYGQVAA